MSKPKCTACDIKGDKYSVFEGMLTTTAMAVAPPYWDEEGKYHVPSNPNTTTMHYRCSNGHTWSEKL